MSVPPSSAAYTASAITNGGPQRETFHKFFDRWLTEQEQFLQELILASKEYQSNNNNNRSNTESSHGESSEGAEARVLRPLISLVVGHYENYYQTKSRCAKHDVLAMLTPSWRSSLEDAFLWIGGWRPSMAFHLLYSISGLQLETQLQEVIHGLNTGDLADLSPSQLTQIDEFQGRTIREEKEIAEKMAKHQETVADTSMVELSHAVSEMIRGGQLNPEEDERVESTLAPKEAGMVEILQKADDLRLETLKGIIDILSPIQAIHFLIAAAELHLRLHDWGKKKDAKEHHSAQSP